MRGDSRTAEPETASRAGPGRVSVSAVGEGPVWASAWGGVRCGSRLVGLGRLWVSAMGKGPVWASAVGRGWLRVSAMGKGPSAGLTRVSGPRGGSVPRAP